ncbi:MAG: TIGR00266 family protein [Pirellulaceae bacterium]|nr:TIGR00266 family protein [Pirellulaceae bacterium]
MEYDVRFGPVFSVVEFRLNQRETVIAQPNSMLSMTGGLELSAALGRSGSASSSGWMGGMKNFLGGENVFAAEFCAKRDQQTLILAPDVHGDILVIPLHERGGYYLTRGSFLASYGQCEMSIKYGGVKGLMARTGIFLMHAVGSGTVFCQTHGAILEKQLADDEKFFIDNRFVVAFSDTVQYQLVKATKKIKDAVLSGEGLVVRYTGPGKVYYQTRSKPAAGWLASLFNAAF